ncbi:MAG: type IV toxin-antitoxin system AbiEi family antitoxin domain-containing protein [Bdellovibrionota bacterium]
MQPIKYLCNWFIQNAGKEHHLFTAQDMRSLFPSLSEKAFKTLLSRAAHAGDLVRVCRGIYVYRRAIPRNGLLLFNVAALLRANDFNYVSLETILSDVGIISQIPMHSISIMSSGRSSIISCGEFGTIEFIHTKQRPTDVMKSLEYDVDCKLWRANVALALRDMKATHRNCDLIDWDTANEFI